MAKKSVTFELSSEEESTLRMWVDGHKTQQRYNRRAQVIFLSAKGMTLKQIIARSGLSEMNCLKWRKRSLLRLGATKPVATIQASFIAENGGPTLFSNDLRESECTFPDRSHSINLIPNIGPPGLSISVIGWHPDK